VKRTNTRRMLMVVVSFNFPLRARGEELRQNMEDRL
jgi:hypothetical protein